MTAPAADEVLPAAALSEWVVFSCEGQRFGVPLALMREVVPPQPLTRLPGCGPEVGGLMGMRGRVVTVFDIGVILGLGSVLTNPDFRILVLDYDERVAGLAVDSVDAIARDQGAILTQMPETGSRDPAFAYAVGIGTNDGRNYLALDPNRILARLLTAKEENHA